MPKMPEFMPQPNPPLREWIGPAAGVVHLVRILSGKRDNQTDCGLKVHKHWVPDQTGTGMICAQCKKTAHLTNNDIIQQHWIQHYD